MLTGSWNNGAFLKIWHDGQWHWVLHRNWNH